MEPRRFRRPRGSNWSPKASTVKPLRSNKLVYAEPKNQAAKDLLADAFEQIGYQKESPSVRNSFLAGAYELRHGIPGGVPPKSTGPDTIRAMSTDLWLDYMGIRLDSKKAMKFVINLVTPDNGENTWLNCAIQR